jgi:hypothetical protein
MGGGGSKGERERERKRERDENMFIATSDKHEPRGGICGPALRAEGDRSVAKIL